jgi:hypothetical protein
MVRKNAGMHKKRFTLPQRQHSSQMILKSARRFACPECNKAPHCGALDAKPIEPVGGYLPAGHAGLQRVAVRFKCANTLLELNDVRGFSEIGFAAATFGGVKPIAYFFNNKCNHDVLQGSDESPVGCTSGISRKRVNPIIGFRSRGASEMLE